MEHIPSKSLRTIIAGSVEWCDQAWSNLIEYRYALFAAFSVALIVYGSELFSFSLSIDEEIYLMHRTQALFLEHGRWGIAILKNSLFPESLSPFFASLVSLAFLCVAAAIMSASLKLSAGERVLFGILYVLFPQFAYQLAFSQQSAELSFGLVCAATAFYLFQNFISSKRWPSFVLCLMVYVFATGIYQALFLVPPTLYMADMLRRRISQGQNENLNHFSLGCGRGCSSQNEYLRFCLFIVTAFGALALYLLLSLLFTKLWSIHVSSYISTHVGWLSLPLHSAITGSAKAIMSHLAGGVYHGEILFVGIYIFLAVLIVSHWHGFFGPDRLWLLAILTGFLLTPFLQILCLGKEQAARTMLGQGVVFATLGTFALSRGGCHKLVVAITVAVCTLIAAAHTSQLFFENTLRWEADKLLASRIVERIYAVKPDFSPHSTKIYIHGAPDVNQPHLQNVETFGSSFFTHDGGNIYRTQAFMKVNDILSFSRPAKAEIMLILGEVDRMPLWPHGQSVGMVDEIMVVKLGKSIGFIEDVSYLSNNP